MIKSTRQQLLLRLPVVATRSLSLFESSKDFVQGAKLERALGNNKHVQTEPQVCADVGHPDCGETGEWDIGDKSSRTWTSDNFFLAGGHLHMANPQRP